MEVLHQIIKEKANDPRAVLNALQLGIIGQASAKSSESDTRIATSFREKHRQAVALAALDSSLGNLKGDCISILARKLPNLDFAGGEFNRRNDPEERVKMLEELRSAMFSAVHMERLELFLKINKFYFCF